MDEVVEAGVCAAPWRNVIFSLLDRVVFRLVHDHAAELPDAEDLAVPAHAFLSEKDRARAVQFDCDGGQDHQRSNQQ